jgi:hypothetical protein
VSCNPICALHPCNPLLPGSTSPMGAVGLALTWRCCLGGVSVSAPVLLGVVVVLVVPAGGEVIGFEKMCCLVVQETRKNHLLALEGMLSRH